MFAAQVDHAFVNVDYDNKSNKVVTDWCFLTPSEAKTTQTVCDCLCIDTSLVLDILRLFTYCQLYLKPVVHISFYNPLFHMSSIQYFCLQALWWWAESNNLDSAVMWWRWLRGFMQQLIVVLCENFSNVEWKQEDISLTVASAVAFDMSSVVVKAEVCVFILLILHYVGVLQ